MATTTSLTTTSSLASTSTSASTSSPGPISLLVPVNSFNMDKKPPPSGNQTTETITITGSDFTKIIIDPGFTVTNSSATNYQYNFTGPTISTTSSPKITIQFPNATIQTDLSGQGGLYRYSYSTPDKYLYNIACQNPTISNVNGIITLTVPSDTINISSANSAPVNRVDDNTDYTPESFEKMIQDKADEASKEIEDTINLIVYQTFNDKFISLIFTLMKDFIVTFSIWLIILNIGVLGTVDANLIYPVDVTKYPYTYNDGVKNYDLSSFTPKDSGFFCEKLTDTSKITADLNKKLEDTDLKEKLEFINPIMSNISSKNVYYTSKIMQSSCSTTGSYSNAMYVFMYWITYLSFTQGLYQDFVLNGFHSLLHKVVLFFVKIVPGGGTVPSIFLAIFIKLLIKAMEPTVAATKAMFHMGLDASSNIIDKPDKGVLLSLVYVVSIVLFVAIPIFFILFFIGLVGHLQSIIRVIVETKSVECTILSMTAMTTTIVAFFKLLGFMVDRNTSLFTLKNFQEQIMNSVNNIKGIVSIISNVAGVCIPLGFALYNSFIISGKLFGMSGYLLTKKKELLKSLSPAIVMVLMFCLLEDVRLILGPFEFYITLFLIAFFGFYFLTKK